jgi:hypothetical protein
MNRLAVTNQVAQEVGQRLDAAIKSMRPWDSQPAAIRRKGRRAEVEAAYRSDLPKEGPYAVGYEAYGEMVDKEIAKWRKVLDRELRPYAKHIKDIEVFDEEKSWIYTVIYLK